MSKQFFALIVAVSLAACGDSAATDAGDDGGVDGGPPPTCDVATVPALEEGDPTGHAMPLAAAPGEARAGRVTAADLPVDPENLATYEPGDYVVANDRIAMVIEDAGPSQLYDPWGGKPVGLFAVEDGALTRPADFNEIAVLVGRHTLEPNSVTVLADGSDGGAAIVRALGFLRPVPFIDQIGMAFAPDDYDDIELAIDYVLAPDADTVEVRYSFRSERPRDARVPLPLLLVFQRYRMPAYVPGAGFEINNGDVVPWIGFVEDGATSYAFRQPAPLTVFLEEGGTLLMSIEPYQIPSCAVTEREVARYDVGGPGLDGLLRVIAAADGETRRDLTGTVREADGSPAAGVRVHIESSDGSYLSRVTSAEDGSYAVSVPEGAVRVRAFRRGEPMTPFVDVAAAETSADLTMADVGFIDVTVRDLASGEPLPARVQVISEPAIDPPPGHYGETRLVRGRTHVVSPGDGLVTLRVAPGAHRVVVSRGYEYEMVSEDVTVVAGETISVTADLERVVETPDVMCGDFHIHTTRSPDSVDSGFDKLLSAAGDGLEIPVRSDHEFVADFEPAIADLGLEAFMYGVASIELTTFVWGHFGVFPLPPDPTMRNDGSFDWAERTPSEVFAEVAARPSMPALIVNHPRGRAIGGYFSAAGYDPATGMVRRPELWDESFGLVEVFNDSDFDRNFDPTGENDSTVADWFSFLNSGHRVYAVGSSDSHAIHSSPVGYPRTCITLGTDDPAVLRGMGADVIRDELAAGHATVSGGIYIDAVARDGAGPGDDVAGAADLELVRVRVQAASFIDADRLRVFVDGAEVTSVVLDESTRDPLVPTTRFDDDLEIPVAAGGSWAVFVADGEDLLEPVHPGQRPFAVSNPIFFTR